MGPRSGLQTLPGSFTCPTLPAPASNLLWYLAGLRQASAQVHQRSVSQARSLLPTSSNSQAVDRTAVMGLALPAVVVSLPGSAAASGAGGEAQGSSSSRVLRSRPAGQDAPLAAAGQQASPLVRIRAGSKSRPAAARLQTELLG